MLPPLRVTRIRKPWEHLAYAKRRHFTVSTDVLDLRLAVCLFSVAILLIFIPTARASFSYSLQVGAYGDPSSQGNLGVQVEIRTHIYDANQGDFDYFWVGDDLANGGFIQFGYSFSPGQYCLQGEVVGGAVATCPGGSANIGASDARWQWEYWPDENGDTNYLGIGPPNSAGDNGTWHSYSIIPNTSNGWDFVLDGQRIANIPFQPSQSKNAAYFVAEKVTSSNPGSLGPVEFRNLAYLMNNGWRTVRELYTLYGCGLNMSCDVVNPYGLSALAPNDVVAGFGLPVPKAGELLWSGSGDNTLALTVPGSAEVMIDGSYCGTGSMEFSLASGEHNVSVPALINIDARTRLRFDHWNDSSTATNRSLNLPTDLSLQAYYVLQYRLTIDSPITVTVSGAGWYDQNSTAPIHTTESQPIMPALGWCGGEWNFGGWYESGKLVTDSANASIVMNSPHVLNLSWVMYPVGPALISLLIVIGSAVLIYRERQTRPTAIRPLVENKRSMTLPIKPRAGSNVTGVPMVGEEPTPLRNVKTCRYCGAEVPQERFICNKCGMPAGYL